MIAGFLGAGRTTLVNHLIRQTNVDDGLIGVWPASRSPLSSGP
ncbi:GTP-binding protein [Deinococcus hohokamensis]|uniref:GTP-binding protein n=1 Tax=Deinococcus hohokamensis TaxID=309883 RepID=A0ABV9IFY7_9DEIO